MRDFFEFIEDAHLAIEGFWSKPPEFGRSREVDPLALSTIHEATADVLLPFLSGRTQHAEDYLWVLVGLRWAGESTVNQREIWNRFEVFEKALKLNFYHLKRHQGFTGVNAVREHYKSGRTDLDFNLVSNQRSQGLLGAYLRSLRAGSLVQSHSLELNDSGRALILAVDFRWAGTISGYGWLERTFNRAKDGFTSRVYRDLGRALFDPEQMYDVAAAVQRLGVHPAWRKAARHLSAIDGKQLVAKIGSDFTDFSRRANAAFWSMLKTPTRSLTHVKTTSLKSRNWRDVVFRSMALEALRRPFDKFLLDLTRHPKRAFIEMHLAVWKHRNHPVPWIHAGSGNFGKIQVRRDIAIKPPPSETEWDLRWEVAHRLISQTKWKPK